jgi:hypothetical protein
LPVEFLFEKIEREIKEEIQLAQVTGCRPGNFDYCRNCKYLTDGDQTHITLRNDYKIRVDWIGRLPKSWKKLKEIGNGWIKLRMREADPITPDNLCCLSLIAGG